MKRVSQREKTRSGWRERSEGKEEQSAERFRLAKKKKKKKKRIEVRGKKNERGRERADLLRLRKEEKEKEKEKERGKMTNRIANRLGIKMSSGTKLSLWIKWVNFGMSWT